MCRFVGAVASDLRPTRATCQTPRSSAAAGLQEGLGEGGAWLLEAQAVPLATGSTEGISRLVRQARPAGCRGIDRRAEMRSGRRCGAVRTSQVAPRGAEGGRRRRRGSRSLRGVAIPLVGRPFRRRALVLAAAAPLALPPTVAVPSRTTPDVRARVPSIVFRQSSARPLAGRDGRPRARNVLERDAAAEVLGARKHRLVRRGEVPELQHLADVGVPAAGAQAGRRATRRRS